MRNLFCLLLLVNASLSGQSIQKMENTSISFLPIQHATFVIQTDSLVIYIDPYGGEEKFKGLPEPDLILITDIHGDHLNLPTLESINTEKARFIVPSAVASKLPEKFKDNAVILDNGSETTYDDLRIEAVPMYNLPEDETSRHTKGRGNGYVITIENKRIYISGDTEDIPEMRNLKNIDIAFVCMNLPYTMDIDQAADAVLEFKPKTVYPYHYRGKPGLSDIEAFKKLVNSGNDAIEVVLLDWYPKP
ncbi:MBL fold metallo-hydrolase [Flavobacteriaceae bacterium M23B6Z8]